MIANGALRVFQPSGSLPVADAFATRLKDSSVDRSLVTRIVITEVVDYHGD